MERHSPGFVIGIIVSIVLGFGIVTGIWLGLSSIGLGTENGVFRATRTGPNSATLELATYPDSHVCHPDAPAAQAIWVTYCTGANGLPTRLEVPPNSVITVVLKQYDSGTALINDYFAQVRGTSQTLNGQSIAMLDGQPFSNISEVGQISKTVKGHTFAADPGHTFTIQSAPNEDRYPIFVSVPLIGVNSSAPANVNVAGNMYPTPNIISFQFRTGPAGITYLWHCYDPCGDTQYARKPPFGFSGPMWTLGYMSGTVSVTNY